MTMIVTNADKNGNTLAWQRYKEGFKSKTTGKPLYKAFTAFKRQLTKLCTRGASKPSFLCL